MKILDMSAGKRAIWFDKQNPLVTFIDIREEVKPDIVADSRRLSIEVGDNYDLIVFDPPHVNFGKNAEMSKTYGWHTTEEIRDIISKTAAEAAVPYCILVLPFLIRPPQTRVTGFNIISCSKIGHNRLIPGIVQELVNALGAFLSTSSRSSCFAFHLMNKPGTGSSAVVRCPGLSLFTSK